MREIVGTSRFPGIAMAAAVVINVTRGLSGLPDNILLEGLKALKAGLSEAEYPEVIIVCDLLFVGSSVKLPGIKIIGFAVEGEDDPMFPLGVPCVSGVKGLLSQAQDEMIVIVDGNRGTVVIDPDVTTVVRYQQLLDPMPEERVFLESTHLPAITQDGRQITVAAVVRSIAEAVEAINEGADELYVWLDDVIAAEQKDGVHTFVDPRIDIMNMLVALAAGKQLSVRIIEPDDNLTKLAEQHGAWIHTVVEDISIDQIIMSENEIRYAVNEGTSRVIVFPDDVASTKNLIRELPGDGLEDSSE